MSAQNSPFFLPQELAYVKAVLWRNSLCPCASENIILLLPDKEYILWWNELPVDHRFVAYHTDGHTLLDEKVAQTRVLHATYFVVFGGPRSGLPCFTAKIVLWRPYAKIWELAKWLQHEAKRGT
jgi:hypothetical protein